MAENEERYDSNGDDLICVANLKTRNERTKKKQKELPPKQNNAC